jgi:hypothetical protein
MGRTAVSKTPIEDRLIVGIFLAVVLGVFFSGWLDAGPEVYVPIQVGVMLWCLEVL